MTNWVPVVIDANGQLGTINPQTGGGMPVPTLSGAAEADRLAAITDVVHAQQQQLQDQQTTIADLQARLARLEAGRK